MIKRDRRERIKELEARQRPKIWKRSLIHIRFDKPVRECFPRLECSCSSIPGEVKKIGKDIQLTVEEQLKVSSIVYTFSEDPIPDADVYTGEEWAALQYQMEMETSRCGCGNQRELLPIDKAIERCERFSVQCYRIAGAIGNNTKTALH